MRCKKEDVVRHVNGMRDYTLMRYFCNGSRRVEQLIVLRVRQSSESNVWAGAEAYARVRDHV